MKQDELRDDPFGYRAAGGHFICEADYLAITSLLSTGVSAEMVGRNHFKLGRYLLASTGDFDQDYMILEKDHVSIGSRMIYNSWLPALCRKLYQAERNARCATNDKGEQDRGAKYAPPKLPQPLPNKTTPADDSSWSIVMIGVLILLCLVLMMTSA